MLILQIILGILALLLLLLVLPVHLRASFNGNLKVRTGVLFINFTLYPRPPVSEKKKQKSEQKKERKQIKEKEELSHTEALLQNEGVAAVIGYYTEMARLIGTSVKRLIRTITVDKLTLQIIVATDDASETAVDFGRVCAVVYPAQALIESVLRVRNRNITITPDFLREKGQFDGEIKLHVIPIRVLWALLLLFISYIGNTITTVKTVHQ